MAVALVSVAFLAALVVCVVLVRRWRTEQAEVRRVRSTFSRYVAPHIVEELLSRKDDRIFTGREQRATILVCRIWNFSHFMEDLTPEQTLRYLNEFYAMAGSSIERQHGVLHRFLEDGAVGIFGIPLEDHHQEDHALRAAINIVRLVNVMQQKWAQQGRRALRVGVGVNSGMVIAGDAGFGNRREYYDRRTGRYLGPPPAGRDVRPQRLHRRLAYDGRADRGSLQPRPDHRDSAQRRARADGCVDRARTQTQRQPDDAEGRSVR